MFRQVVRMFWIIFEWATIVLLLTCLSQKHLYNSCVFEQCFDFVNQSNSVEILLDEKLISKKFFDLRVLKEVLHLSSCRPGLLE